MLSSAGVDELRADRWAPLASAAFGMGVGFLALGYLAYIPRLAMYMHTIRWLRGLLVLLLGR